MWQTWKEKFDEWLGGPCQSCNEKVAMPVTRPQYVDPYLESLTGPNEQHDVGGTGHCINPKCQADFPADAYEQAEWNNGWYTCPNCGAAQNLLAGEAGTGTQTYKQDDQGKAVLNPGGITRSGLTLSQMGDIGEKIVARLGDLPGVGQVKWHSTENNFPIDMIVGPYGCEVKANHSQAQERFKVGGKEERASKIKYCLQEGLRPALIGVRLNFYTDLAYVFFREGLTDTWIGNSKMQHVGTFNFADLNPFKSPNPQARQIEIEHANLPDQADEADEFAGVFGKTASDWRDQPRTQFGQFTFKHGVKEMKVMDHKGKHLHTLKRCKQCGTAYGHPAGHKGRIECPTCGGDPERSLHLAKLVVGANTRPAEQLAKQFGWEFAGSNANGHRMFDWTDDNGINHRNIVGSGQHSDDSGKLDATFLRQRMQRCMNGTCLHAEIPMGTPLTTAPGELAFPPGTTVQIAPDQFGLVMNIDGEQTLVQNFQTGKKDYIPTEQLQQVANRVDKVRDG